jgi:hypothetical protein
MGWIDGAKLRLDGARAAAGNWLKAPKLPDWWRRTDRSAERAAVATRATGFLASLYLGMAVWAWVLEFGFTALWAIRANGEFDWTWRHVVIGADWSFNFSAHVLPAILTVGAAGLIVGVSVTWLPGYNGLAGMGRVRRSSLAIVGPLCTFFAILGAIVVSTDNANMDARDAVSVQEQAQQSRESIQRQIDGVNQQLAAMRDRRSTNEYAALAATVGEQQYRQLYICDACLAREHDAARRQLLLRAVGAAVAADRLQAQQARLETQLKNAPTEASLRSTAHAVEDHTITGLVQWASDYRIVLLGCLTSVIGLLWLWLAQGLREAHALTDPDAPVREKAEARKQDRAEAETDALRGEHAPPGAEEPWLDLPPLPDLRGVEDAEFDGLSATVDEEGRILKRVQSWRAPRAKNDKRRAPDTLAVEEPAPAATTAANDAPLSYGADESEEDPFDWMARQAQHQAEETIQ